MPYSYKELKEINSENEFHKVIFKIFGDFEQFLMTHEEELGDDTLVELIKLDVSLLQVPFTYHNKLLINRILKIESFWQQVTKLIKSFYETNCKDPRYLLLIDMKGFLENIESLLCWLTIHNHHNSEILSELISTLESFSEDESLKHRLNELKSFNSDQLNYEVKIYFILF
jgi:hypothetical protein